MSHRAVLMRVTLLSREPLSHGTRLNPAIFDRLAHARLFREFCGACAGSAGAEPVAVSDAEALIRQVIKTLLREVLPRA